MFTTPPLTPTVPKLPLWFYPTLCDFGAGAQYGINPSHPGSAWEAHRPRGYASSVPSVPSAFSITHDSCRHAAPFPQPARRGGCPPVKCLHPSVAKTMRFPREIQPSHQIGATWLFVPMENPLFSRSECAQNRLRTQNKKTVGTAPATPRMTNRSAQPGRGDSRVLTAKNCRRQVAVSRTRRVADRPWRGGERAR